MLILDATPAVLAMAPLAGMLEVLPGGAPMVGLVPAKVRPEVVERGGALEEGPAPLVVLVIIDGRGVLGEAQDLDVTKSR